MASSLSIGRLSALLSEAAADGCTFVWMQDGRLLAGPDRRHPLREVDFADETLRAPVRRRRTRLASAEAPGTAAEDRPARSETPARVDVAPLRPGRQTGRFSLVLEDKRHSARSQRELLLVALQEIERERPGTLDKLAADKGRTKRVVSRDRETLYARSHLAKHADEIEGGWWVATNNSYPEVEKFVRRAAWHAGLHVEMHRSP